MAEESGVCSFVFKKRVRAAGSGRRKRPVSDQERESSGEEGSTVVRKERRRDTPNPMIQKTRRCTRERPEYAPSSSEDEDPAKEIGVTYKSTRNLLAQKTWEPQQCTNWTQRRRRMPRPSLSAARRSRRS
ncbi:putative zinc finger protein 183 [Taeniopygia guttata]|uniref:Putative zinc finger protein 183 n=1 Tax=Taeniopygia guttata TaxID=59729 RepID=B5FX89_TAEGU|nr:putative zinc finger protein 183 [Taeniopygia guttata]ACH43650.1 putative zinc finger protein 183 [Taeniopygia guttata]